MENTQPAPEIGFDLLLDGIASAAANGVCCPVTLHIGGMLLSGTLCSEEDWFADLGRRLHQGLKDPKHQPIAEGLVSGLQLSRDAIAKEKPRDAFLHLSGAHWLSPGGPQIPTDSSGTYCRVRVSEVSAWSLEKIERVQNS